MKKTRYFIFITAILLVYTMSCWMPWHLNRNKHNFLPSGTLVLVQGSVYKDSKNRNWHLQEASRAVLHQTELLDTVPLVYPNILPALRVDSSSPNLKFTSPIDNYASAEGIVLPSGDFLQNGKERGTYNYFESKGFIGTLGHIVLDLVPHLINSDYAP